MPCVIGWFFSSDPGAARYSFLNASAAKSDKLAFVNSAGNAIMKVDNTTTVAFNDKRNTIRISSKDSYGVGSVFVADMLHVPYGVGLSCLHVRARSGGARLGDF